MTPEKRYIADMHLGHENIIKFCGRPFGSAAEMNRILLENYNRVVQDEDTVYLLGDVFFRCGKPNEEAQLLSRMKGKKILVLGNHDPSWLHKVDLSLYFEQVVEDKLEIMDRSRRVTLCHYPLLDEVYTCDRGFMVHGHIHNNGPNMPEWPQLYHSECLLNASVEVIRYQPCTLDELIERNEVFKVLHPCRP